MGRVHSKDGAYSEVGDYSKDGNHVTCHSSTISIMMYVSLGAVQPFLCLDHHRSALQSFLIRLHQSDGSYILHDNGEVDVRYNDVIIMVMF